jgi:hypothetical protein
VALQVCDSDPQISFINVSRVEAYSNSLPEHLLTYKLTGGPPPQGFPPAPPGQFGGQDQGGDRR